MPGLGKIYREPGEEKPGQCRDAILAEINANQHAMAQQLFDDCPGEQGSLGSWGTIGIHESPALLYVRDLGRGNARVAANVVNAAKPDPRKDESQCAHKPEAAFPSGHVGKPSQDGREDPQRKILRRIEDRGSSTPLARREPGGDDTPVSREDRSLGKTGHQAKNKDGGKSRTRTQKTGEAIQQRAYRPNHKTDAVDSLRAKVVEQSSTRQLPQHVSPAESGKEVAHVHRVQGSFPVHRGSSDGKSDPVAIAEAAHSEQDGNDQVADMGVPGLRQGQERPAMSRASSACSASVR